MFRFVALLALAAFASAEITNLCEGDLTSRCVATHLAEVAGCIPPRPLGFRSRFPKSFSAPRFLIEAPFFSGTIDRYLSRYTGIEGAEITAFYTDSEKDKTVLTVNFPELVSKGRENIWYHSAGQIDTELDTSFEVTYTNMAVTAQWNGVDAITIGTARVYTETEEQEYTLDDFSELSVAIAADPTGAPAVAAQLSADYPEVLRREHALAIGRSAGRIYWKNFLCSNLE